MLYCRSQQDHRLGPRIAWQVLEALMERQDLSEAQASGALKALVAGAEPAQMGAFLALLRAKGETAEEVAGLARAMRELCVPVQTSYDGERWGGGSRPGRQQPGSVAAAAQMPAVTSCS
jgi:anthranilate phosphoribosyltransferase